MLTSPITTIDASSYLELKAGDNAAELRFYEAKADGYGSPGSRQPNYMTFQVGDINFAEDDDGSTNANPVIVDNTNVYGDKGITTY